MDMANCDHFTMDEADKGDCLAQNRLSGWIRCQVVTLGHNVSLGD